MTPSCWASQTVRRRMAVSSRPWFNKGDQRSLRSLAVANFAFVLIAVITTTIYARTQNCGWSVEKGQTVRIWTKNEFTLGKYLQRLLSHVKVPCGQVLLAKEKYCEIQRRKLLITNTYSFHKYLHLHHSSRCNHLNYYKKNTTIWWQFQVVSWRIKIRKVNCYEHAGRWMNAIYLRHTLARFAAPRLLVTGNSWCWRVFR